MPGTNTNLLQGAVAIVVLFTAIGIGLWLINRARRAMIEPAEDMEDMWSQIEEAYESGEMNEDEYRRVRSALLGQDRRPHPKGGGLKLPPDVGPRVQSTTPEVPHDAKRPDEEPPPSAAQPSGSEPPIG
ncbi:MAG TPA: hypothetical protein VF590_27475 [Isosphaeraceae bacterium]